MDQRPSRLTTPVPRMARLWPLSLLAASAVLAGCASTRWGGLSRPSIKPPASGILGLDIAQSILVYALGISLVLALAASVAKMAGLLLIPRKAIAAAWTAAIVCIILVSLVDWLGRNALLAAILAVGGVAVFGFWPLIHGFINRKIYREGLALAKKPEHIEAAVAILSTVDPKINRNRKAEATVRKVRLVKPDATA